jgi:hypothetical protein
MLSPNEIQVIYPLKKFAGNLMPELNESVFREISFYCLLQRKGLRCCQRPVSIFKNNDMIVFVHPKPRYKLKWLMPRKDLLERHGITILKMLLEELFTMNRLGVAHRDLHPGNIWVNESFDGLLVIGFYNSCSESRKRDLIAMGTPPYFLNRHGCWSPGSMRWDLHAWAVIASEMMLEVQRFSTCLNGKEFWRVIERSTQFIPYTKLHDVLRDLLKFGELLHVKDQHQTILAVLEDSEFKMKGRVLWAQNKSEQYDPLRDDIVAKYGTRAFY